MLWKLFRKFSGRSRAKRAQMFRDSFPIGPETTILDLGGGTGGHIASVLGGPAAVTVADISESDLAEAAKRGFRTVQLTGDEDVLPFDDGAFDIVFCSSVIEHVTGPKEEMRWMTDDRRFNDMADRFQGQFASELRRVSKGYFVQTPYKYFPVESHSWLPVFIVMMPRWMMVPTIRFTNRFWPKGTRPDFRLLTRRGMQDLFPDASILEERSGGFTKSLIAVRKG
ncbi:MAG: methyltransferase domain-containing protein [Minwuia sp.]|uniref:class I SAM-dependent methyltransferase n=1 Tax=Minwuia sp. TaxID=2493630 RepID=UPI003A8899E8